MTDRPIIFSGPMVRALLEGRKTQTRRLATSPLRNARAGDWLYVRECFAEVGDGYLAVTRADYPACVPRHFENVPPIEGVKWRPSIHMPRRLSRLTLEVTGVLIEPLQQISPADCVAEGHPRADASLPEEVHLDAARDWYMDLWDSLHRKEGDRWRDNPLVVALEFEVRRGNVDS